MSTIHVAVLVGSLRRESLNRRLAGAIARLAPQDVVFEQLEIRDLPLYDQDDDGHQAEPVRRLKAALTAADGVMFVTPEYNRSVPGVLKNAIDHASRPYGSNAFAGKPAGIIGCTPGALGSALAQQHLRNIVAYLDMPTLNQPEAYLNIKDGFFDGSGDIGPTSRAFVQGWVDAFVAHLRRYTGG